MKFNYFVSQKSDKLQWACLSLDQRLLNLEMALLEIECLVDPDVPEYDQTNIVQYEQTPITNSLQSSDYKIFVDIENEIILASIPVRQNYVT